MVLLDINVGIYIYWYLDIYINKIYKLNFSIGTYSKWLIVINCFVVLFWENVGRS